MVRSFLTILMWPKRLWAEGVYLPRFILNSYGPVLLIELLGLNHDDLRSMSELELQN